MSILELMGTESFQVGFWSNLLAGLVTGLVFAFWLNRATNLFKKPDLRMVIKQNGTYRDTILMTENADGEYEASFQLVIKNTGNQTIKPGEGFWHTSSLSRNRQLNFLLQGKRIIKGVLLNIQSILIRLLIFRAPGT